MRYFVSVGGRTVEVNVAAEGITVDGRAVDADVLHLPGTRVRSLMLDGASHRLVVRRTGSGAWEVYLRGRTLAVEVVDERTRVIREMTGQASRPSGPRPLKAPMPGLVVKIEVDEGDVVHPGQGLVIVEAMKMENELKAEAQGRVKQVHVSIGQAVEKDQLLIDFEAPEGEG